MRDVGTKSVETDGGGKERTGVQEEEEVLRCGCGERNQGTKWIRTYRARDKTCENAQSDMPNAAVSTANPIDKCP